MTPEQERELDLLKTATIKLSEHFDSVQIFTTRHDEHAGGTVNLNWGSGNFFTRFGQIQLWLIEREETAKQSNIEKDF